jgi:hypothetical protein
MLTCVIGFPVPLWIGIALTSIFEVETAGNSAPDAELVSSFLTAGFTAASLEVVLCGIFLMSLYFD